MTDNEILKKVTAEEVALKADIAAKQERLDQLAVFRSLYQHFLHNQSTGLPLPPQLPPLPLPPVPKAQQIEPVVFGRKASVTDAAYQVLQDGWARHTDRLLEALRTQGVEVGGKNPLMNLSSALSRDSRFKNSRKTGWSLSEAPASPVRPGEAGFEDI